MAQGVSVNASMLLAIVSKLAIGETLTAGHYLVLHPLAFAGWLGLMITAWLRVDLARCVRVGLHRNFSVWSLRGTAVRPAS